MPGLVKGPVEIEVKKNDAHQIYRKRGFEGKSTGFVKVLSEMFILK
ncbi:hypothetical protein LG296_14950 [Ureibacillus chungkukjangi]